MVYENYTPFPTKFPIIVWERKLIIITVKQKGKFSKSVQEILQWFLDCGNYNDIYLLIVMKTEKCA